MNNRVRHLIWLQFLLASLLPQASSMEKNIEMLNHTPAELRQKYENTGDIKFVRSIIRLLSSKDEQQVLQALHSLNVLGARVKSEVGPEVIEAIDPLLKNSKDPGMLHSLTATILSYAEYALPVKERLEDIVKENSSGAAFFAAQSLGLLGSKANDAQGALVGVLGSNTKTEIYAAESLAMIGIIEPKNLQLIHIYLAKENLDPYTEIGLLKVLLLNDLSDPRVTERLTSYLKSSVSRQRYKALESLSGIEIGRIPWAKSIVEQLANDDPDRSIREYANGLIKKKEGRPERVKP